MTEEPHRAMICWLFISVALSTAPVPGEEWTQVLEVGLGARATILASDVVFRRLTG